MIKRPRYISAFRRALDSNPIVAILGPRQSGKTTLARLWTHNIASHFLDMENPAHRDRLSNPMLALKDLSGLIVIDEIQRRPEILETLRVLVDRPDGNSKYLILGSASPHLVKSASESLAGRVGFVDLSGFDLSEVGKANTNALWSRGGFPRSFLARDHQSSYDWRENFVRTFLERDIPQLGMSIPADTLRRFWIMTAHYHGNVWNAAEFARSLGRSEPTARRYLDILSGSYMVRQLQPWHENLKKRQVKSPKIYVRDSGILHTLLGLENEDDILQHPKLGASWEGFIIEQILSWGNARHAYFWSTHSGAEIDLLLIRGGKRIGIEIKYADAPKTSKSMRSALSDLNLDDVYIVYPGTESYPLDDKICALSILDLASALPWAPAPKSTAREFTSGTGLRPVESRQSKTKHCAEPKYPSQE